MEKRDLYFRHTGEISVQGSLMVLLINSAVALVAGAIYGALVYYIPYVYFNFLLTAGLGFVLAYVVAFTAQFSHTRNAAALLLGGVVVGLVAMYAAWVAWLYALSDRQALLLRPDDIWNAMSMLAEQGVWSLGSPAQRTKGVMLQAVWLIEAGIIVGMTAGLSFMLIRRIPYCASCRRWLADIKDEQVYTFAPLENVESARRALAAGDLRVLGHLRPQSDRTASRTRVTVVGCDHLHVMTIDSVDVTTNSKGNRSESVRTLARNLLLDRQSHERLGQMASEQ